MRRRLGQHFLVDQNIQKRILNALQLRSEDSVLEIGPGQGALTFGLSRLAKRILLVEKDPVLSKKIEEKYLSEDTQVLNIDFLNLCWGKVTEYLGENFKVISNLPYQSSVAILKKLILANPSPETMVLMFQKEVGDRLLAEPFNKNYGSLTVWVRLFCQVKKLFQVSPQAFRPPPQVESLVLKFSFRPQPQIKKDDLAQFDKLLAAGFAHRRKMLRQNLRSYFNGNSALSIEKKLEAVQANPTARAEELSVEQWIDLYQRD